MFMNIKGSWHQIVWGTLLSSQFWVLGGGYATAAARAMSLSSPSWPFLRHSSKEGRQSPRPPPEEGEGKEERRNGGCSRFPDRCRYCLQFLFKAARITFVIIKINEGYTQQIRRMLMASVDPAGCHWSWAIQRAHIMIFPCFHTFYFFLFFKASAQREVTIGTLFLPQAQGASPQTA